MDKNHFQIIVRSCPISSKVVSQKPSRYLRAQGDHSLRWSDLSRDALFTFDNIIGENASQTGIGKSYTMFGDIDHVGGGVSENQGIIPRVFEKLFSRIQLEEKQRKDENLKYWIECSFLEIYKEKIVDLLQPASINLQDLSKIVMNDVQDVMLLLGQGSANKKMAIRNNSKKSSRFHGVLFCTIKSTWDCNSMTQTRFARLNFVELAGNKRQDICAVEGKVLDKASKINVSISHLRLVIKCVFNVANGKKVHIPYRNSKLTYFLEDSLGVNSRIILIATVSPAKCNSDDTLNTLKFAQQFRPLYNIQQRTKLLPAEMEQRRCLVQSRIA